MASGTCQNALQNVTAEGMPHCVNLRMFLGEMIAFSRLLALNPGLATL